MECKNVGIATALLKRDNLYETIHNSKIGKVYFVQRILSYCINVYLIHHIINDIYEQNVKRHKL